MSDPTSPSIRPAPACEESARAHLVSLQETAVDVLAEELENKRSAKIAALLLDRMGVLTRPAGRRGHAAK